MITTYQTFVQSIGSNDFAHLTRVNAKQFRYFITNFGYSFPLYLLHGLIITVSTTVTRNGYYKLSIWPKFLVRPNF